MKPIATERLLLRPWSEADYPEMLRFFSDPETANFVGGTKNEEEVWRLLATYIGHLQLKGYSYLAIEEKSTGALVGAAGLWNSEPWPELELGYWVIKEHQGKGYATEAAKCLLDFEINLGVNININVNVNYSLTL